MRNGHIYNLKIHPLKILMNYINGQNHCLIVKTSGRHHHGQVLKQNSTSNWIGRKVLTSQASDYFWKGLLARTVLG